MKTPNNPDAFPLVYQNGEFQPGMTLRDYFAAEAISRLTIKLRPRTLLDRLKLLLRNFGFEFVVSYERNMHLESDAEFCYAFADAMLKQRDL